MGNKLIKDKKKLSMKVNEGVRFYNIIGGTFIACGMGSLLLLGFVSLLPQDYKKYNIPLFFGIWFAISVALLIIGVIPLLLGKYNRKYQIWIEKEVNSYNKRNEDRMLKQGEKLIKKTKKRKQIFLILKIMF